MLDWSTTEQDTGAAYVDGKRIFVKTVLVTAGPNNNAVTFPHGIVGLDTVLLVRGGMSFAGTHFPLPYADNTDTTSLETTVTPTDLSLRSGVGVNYAVFAGAVQLFYTKA